MSSVSVRRMYGRLLPDIASMGWSPDLDPHRQEGCLAGTTSPLPTRIPSQCSKDLRFEVASHDQRPFRPPNRSVPSLPPRSIGCCGGIETATANSGTSLQSVVHTADLRPRHPRRRNRGILDHADPAGPNGGSLVRGLYRLPAVIGGAACFRRRRVKKATPFARPFLQEFYGIHNTLDLSENEAIVPHENRLLERSTFHSDLPSDRGAPQRDRRTAIAV